jgi:protein SCO1/2
MPPSGPISSGFISLLFTALLGAKTYPVDGIVVALEPAQNTIVVSHRPIPRLMPAMTMPFRLENPTEIRNLHIGARVQFELAIENGKSFARHLRTVGGTDLDIPAPRDRKKIGEKIPDFTLTDQDSHPVRLSDFRGKVVAVNFIYTRCPLPDVCPRLSANFALLQRRFRRHLGKELVRLSMTIDPQYDTPEVLQDYAKRWGAQPESWRFLTGPAEEIQRTAGHFGLVFWPDEGALGHNSTTSIVGRDGRLAAIVEGSSYRVDQLVDLIARQLEAAQ